MTDTEHSRASSLRPADLPAVRPRSGQGRFANCLFISVAGHLAVVGVALFLSTGAQQAVKPVSIDLTLSPPTDQTVMQGHTAEPPAPARRPAVKAVLPVTPVPADLRPEPLVTGIPALPEKRDTGGMQLNEPPVPGPGVTSSVPVEKAGTQPAKPADRTGETAQQRYLKEQFAYIRDLIRGGVSYPLMAQRRGWSGTVKVSFSVSVDGSIHSLSILKSSGHRILDEYALEAVRAHAPFPKPPVPVEIILPIDFILR